MPVHAFAVKAAKQALESFEYEPGPLAPHEVEVRVTHCGICHSDVAMIDNDWHWTRYPLVPGHEVVGEIVAVGADVDARKVGQRVGIGWQNSSCMRCEWCNRAQEAWCPNEVDTIVGHHGGFASTVRAHWKFSIPIPDAIASADAAPLMCAGTTVFTPLLHFDVKPGMRASVVGIGGLGHLAVQYLAKWGCEVTAISTTHSKDEEAKSLGATKFIATKGTDELKKAANSFDFMLFTASGDVPWPQYIEALRPGGQLVACGSPESQIAVPAFALIAKEKGVHGGRTGSPAEVAAMLEFTARHGIKPMIERFPLKEAQKGIDRLRSGKARYRVVLEA